MFGLQTLHARGHLVVSSFLCDFDQSRVPTGSGKQGKQGKNNGQGKVREKSGNFILGQKSGKSQGILF